jgi:hypothetical protein
MKRSSMAKIGLAALMAGTVISCGATPKEVNFYMQQIGALCDLIHKPGCLTADQLSQLQTGLYFGQNAGDCRAVYDVAQIDSAVRATFANRNYDDTSGNTCISAVQKLTCDDLKKMLSNLLTAGNYGMDDTLAKNARTSLGYPDPYACRTMAGNCLAEPACNLSIPAGPCAKFKFAPLKDPTLKQKEATDAADPKNADSNCGQAPFLSVL